MQPGEERDRGDEEDRDLRGGGERDLAGEGDLSAERDDDRAAVLGGVADDRDDDRGDEELAEPRLLGEDLERADEDLRDERGRRGGDRQRDERSPQRPAADLLVARDVAVRCAAGASTR